MPETRALSWASPSSTPVVPQLPVFPPPLPWLLWATIILLRIESQSLSLPLSFNFEVHGDKSYLPCHMVSQAP